MLNAHLTTTTSLCHRTIITKLCPMPTVPDCTQCPYNIIILGALCTATAKLSRLGIPHHIFISQYTFHTNFIMLPIMPGTLGVTTPTQPLVHAIYYSIGLMPLLICPAISHPTCGTIPTPICTVSPGFHSPALRLDLHPPFTFVWCLRPSHFQSGNCLWLLTAGCQA